MTQLIVSLMVMLLWTRMKTHSLSRQEAEAEEQAEAEEGVDEGEVRVPLTQSLQAVAVVKSRPPLLQVEV